MDHKVIASIIAWSTLIITVGAFVLLGLLIARRNKLYPKKIELLDDGFLYHGTLGDTRVRWHDIISAKVKKYQGTAFRQGVVRGKTTTLWTLDIVAGKKDFFIDEMDFETIDFDDFIGNLEKRVREGNPAFKGIGGDIEKLRGAIQKPHQMPPEEIAEEAASDDLIRRVESRIAAVGRPVTKKERMAILMEEMKK